ncbi:hypothetical protein [Thermococcus sp.]|uniref:hypothetical protein n=1 Tax=Thermococcus sp. TaxID=35749 RepID=UPI002620AD4D|nr:hypothetical protein [Thermococcus sp.]
MKLEPLYSTARSELAKDLVFEIEGEPVTLSVKGILLAKINSKGYNFSFFELSEDEIVLAIQMKGFVVYIGMEADEDVEEEAYPQIARILLEILTPGVALLVDRAERTYEGRADVLLDDEMGQDMKEFFYGLILKHRRGESVYEQTEVA